MLPMLALANISSQGFGFETASGTYFIHFSEGKKPFSILDGEKWHR